MSIDPWATPGHWLAVRETNKMACRARSAGKLFPNIARSSRSFLPSHGDLSEIDGCASHFNCLITETEARSFFFILY